jgi:hypothetical protein
MNSKDKAMKNEEIKRLTERFFDGESTEEEEKLLRALFSGGDCPAGFEAEQEYIRYCLDNTKMSMPSDGFNTRILDAVGQEAPVRKLPGKLIIYSSAVAASVIIFVTVYILAGNNRSYPDTYNDPEIAYAETMKILHDVSSRLNSGTKSIAPLGKFNSVSRHSIGMVNESASLINDSFSKLDAIDRFSSLNYNRKVKRIK